jgi:transposase
VLILTPGNTAGCVIAQKWVSLIPGIKELLADKNYDTDSFRAFLRKEKIKPVISGTSNRKKRIRHARKASKRRRIIARCFGRLKDFRRIATRYDKLAGNFFSALCLGTTGRAKLPPQLAHANQENKLAPCKLASIPAHMLNQNNTDSGIPHRPGHLLTAPPLRAPLSIIQEAAQLARA